MSDGPTGSSKRPWIAAALSVLYPGLGHVYLRLWGRALLWFLSIVTAAALLVPPEAVPTTFSPERLMTAARTVPLSVTLTLLVMTVLNVADAYRMGKRTATAGAAGAESEASGPRTCPNCGKEVDHELSFCQWCSEDLE